MSKIEIESPTTGARTKVDEADLHRYIQAGWVDLSGKPSKPKRGAPEPDLDAGRAALDKVATARRGTKLAQFQDSAAESTTTTAAEPSDAKTAAGTADAKKG